MTRSHIEIARKERRRDKRRVAMLPASLDGHPVEVSSLSLGGIGAGGLEFVSSASLALAPGQSAELRLPRDGPESVTLQVEIVRVAGRDDLIGASFVDLDDSQCRHLERLIIRHREMLDRKGDQSLEEAGEP